MLRQYVLDHRPLPGHPCRVAFETVREPMARANVSTQYLATVAYGSLFDRREETINTGTTPIVIGILGTWHLRHLA